MIQGEKAYSAQNWGRQKGFFFFFLGLWLIKHDEATNQACLGPYIIYGPFWAQSVAYGNSNQWATNQAGLYGCGTLRQVKAHLISPKRIAKLLHRTCSLPWTYGRATEYTMQCTVHSFLLFLYMPSFSLLHLHCVLAQPTGPQPRSKKARARAGSVHVSRLCAWLPVLSSATCDTGTRHWHWDTRVQACGLWCCRCNRIGSSKTLHIKSLNVCMKY